MPQIRPTQILADGEMDLSNAYGIGVSDVSERDYLHDGEVLFNNTNSTSLVGKSAVFREPIPAVCSNHVTRLNLIEGIQPEFVALVLNTLQSLGYFASLSTKFNNQAGVNTVTLGNVRIPIPFAQDRGRLVSYMEAARYERKTKLSEADALLAEVDIFVLDALGIAIPSEDNRSVFAVRGRISSHRLDPHFYSPRFTRITDALSRMPCESLGDIVSFSKETWKPESHAEPTFRYIEISTVSPQTGQAGYNEVPTAEAPSRARMRVQPNDIIVSLTRPHHGSIALLGSDFGGCIASTGFSVIRGVAQHVGREYLWCVLRTQICLMQMLQRSSGGNYPAIIESELARITVPVPDLSVQNAIAAEVRRRQDRSAYVTRRSGNGLASG